MPGEYVDKELKCQDCGTPFQFTSGEQERFAQLGFTNEPKRCKTCRAARKKSPERAREVTRPTGEREIFTTKCAACGNEARVPFKPRGDRPVYCSECFNKK